MNRQSHLRGHGAARPLSLLPLLLAAGLLYLGRPAMAQQQGGASIAGTGNSCGLQPVIGLELPSGSNLTAVTGSGADVWAVGNFRGDFSSNPTLTMHWDGSFWSYVYSPSPGMDSNILQDVTGSGSDVWAVGSYWIEGAVEQTLTLHWDGSSWSHVASPNPGTGVYHLNAVTGSGSDVWAVGYYSNADGTFPRTLTLHWNGSTWSHVASPSPTDYNVLSDVTGSGSDVWAVGSAGGTLLLHWDGNTWIRVPNPVDRTALNGVTGSGSDVWAVGYTVNEISKFPQTSILHWDGSSWSQVASPSPGTEGNILQDVTGSGSDVWAVGSYWTEGAVEHTLMLHWDGSSWSHVANPNYNNLVDVTGSGDDVWAIGGPGGSLLLHRSEMPFVDVPPGNPFHEYICDLYYQSIIEGYPDSTFHWEQNATRVTLARWIVKARGWEFDLRDATHFSDVRHDHPDYNYVETAYNKGVISGYAPADCPGGELACFKPDNSVTRGQLSKMVVNAMGWQTNIAGGPHFVDVDPSNPFYWQIETIFNLGVVSGYDDFTFRWGNDLTRGQLTKVLSNSLDHRSW